ncbi:hypothetical protein TNCV_2831631 [Trichonephila clavipes]|nr:hypothetical protein TNCV_2831631 [Trichonephila clavipes]
MMIMIPAYNGRGTLLSIRDGNPLQAKIRLLFLKKIHTSVPYSGFEPKATQLQAEGHIHYTDWVAGIMLAGLIGVKKLWKRCMCDSQYHVWAGIMVKDHKNLFQLNQGFFTGRDDPLMMFYTHTRGILNAL